LLPEENNQKNKDNEDYSEDYNIKEIANLLTPYKATKNDVYLQAQSLPDEKEVDYILKKKILLEPKNLSTINRKII